MKYVKMKGFSFSSSYPLISSLSALRERVKDEVDLLFEGLGDIPTSYLYSTSLVHEAVKACPGCLSFSLSTFLVEAKYVAKLYSRKNMDLKKARELAVQNGVVHPGRLAYFHGRLSADKKKRVLTVSHCERAGSFSFTLPLASYVRKYLRTGYVLPDEVHFNSEHQLILSFPEKAISVPIQPPRMRKVQRMLALDLNSDSMMLLYMGGGTERIVKVAYPPELPDLIGDVLSEDTAKRRRARKGAYLTMKALARTARALNAMVLTEVVDNYPYNRYYYYLRKAVRGEGLPFIEVPSHMNSSICPVHSAYLHGDGKVKVCPAGEKWDRDVVAVFNIASAVGYRASGRKRWPDAEVRMKSAFAVKENASAILSHLMSVPPR